jgi:hypothetical protein
MTYLDYICHTLKGRDWDMSKTYLLTLDGDVGFRHRDVMQVLGWYY